MTQHPSFWFGEIAENRDVAPGHYRMTIRLPASFMTPLPGQFVMIREPDRREPLLPRPISVHAFARDGEGALLTLLCRVAGRATGLFSRLPAGAPLTVLGPLGRGFRIAPDVRRLLLVGGGVGAAPLAMLLRGGELPEGCSGAGRITAYLGAATGELLTGLDRFRGFCDLRTATDDGSSGHPGPVTALLARDLPGYDPAETLVLACGPTAMTRAVARLLAGTGFRCQVSLEERMACGVGACLGCAVAVRDGQGGIAYRRVCHDGPVFELDELLFAPSVA